MLDAPAGAAGRRAVVFRRLLVNTLVSGVTSSFLWFALTFWVYLETRSVVATGVIGGAFSLASAALGPAFGTYVDHHRKHTAMMLATAVSAGCFAVATAGLRRRRRRRPAAASTRPWFWLLVGRHAARLGRRADARHRPVDLRDAARARGPAATGPTAWSARSPASRSPSRRCSAGSSSACSGWAGRYYGVAGPHRSARSSTCARSDRRAGARRRPPPRRPPHVDVRGALDAIRAVPGPADADRPGRLQQPARRRVHGADGRLRAVAGVGRDVGPAVGLHQPGLHRRRPASSPGSGSGRCPLRIDPARQPRQLDGVLGVRRCGRRSCCSTIGMVVWLASSR